MYTYSEIPYNINLICTILVKIHKHYKEENLSLQTFKVRNWREDWKYTQERTPRSLKLYVTPGTVQAGLAHLTLTDFSLKE